MELDSQDSSQDALWQDFAKQLEKSRSNIFQAMEGFYGSIYNRARDCPPNSRQEYELLLEANFWLLFRQLYEFRSKASGETNKRGINSLEENKIVLKWLQQSIPTPELATDAPSTKWTYTRLYQQGVRDPSASSFETPVIFSNKMPDIWETAFAGTSSSPSVPATGNSVGQENLISALDVDAPLRESKNICPEDAQNDSRVFRTAFELLRKGEIYTAAEWCRRTGNFCMGIAIQGLGLGEGDISKHAKQLWRESCLKLARRQSNAIGYPGKHERAVYGLLVGDLESVLPLCDTWETQFIAYLIHICAQQERILEEENPSEFATKRALSQVMGVDRAMDLLANSDNVAICEESANNCRILDAAVINDRIADIISSSANNLRMFENRQVELCPEVADPNILRKLGNAIVCLACLGVNTGRGTATVIQAFVGMLVDQGLRRYVPIYISFFQGCESVDAEVLTELYAEVLRDITDEVERSEHLRLSKQFHVDIGSSISQAFNMLFKATAEDYYGNEVSTVRHVEIDPRVSQLDEELYATARWFESSEMWPEALDVFTQLYTRLLVSGKINSFYEFATETPPNKIINQVDRHDFTQSQSSSGSNSNSAQQRTLLLGYNKLLTCITALNNWKQLSGNYSDSKEWKELAIKQVNSIRGLVHNLCDEWLKESSRHIEDKKLMEQLQTTYLPYLILEYEQVLLDCSELGDHYIREACEMANVVAHPESKLSHYFSKSGTLGLLLDKIAEASVLSMQRAELD